MARKQPMLRRGVLVGLGAGLAMTVGVAWANPYETTLGNGMKVIVKEDRRAPSVVHMVWYKVGAMDETDGHSGVAHILEHMMFKGTKKLGPGEFNRQVAAVGGRDNAFTSSDYTAYFQQVPPGELGRMMGLEADRMRNLRFSDEEFFKELEVVKEERRLRTDDKPHGLVHEQLEASAFLAHPYRRPIIGWMTDLDTMRPADAWAWYRTWYAPNNATLVVVGDVDHRRVFEQAKQSFGGLVPSALPPRRDIGEPEQRGRREAEVRAPAELPYLALAWHVPTLRSLADARDYFALQVLSAVLDGYEGARLNTRLVREQRLAVSAGAGYTGMARGPSLFLLDGTPSPGHSVDELEAALRAEVARIRDQGVTDAELARVKAQAMASEVYKRDSLMGQAMEIGMLEMSGFSWRDEKRFLEGLQTVTAADVQAVAGRYFADDAMTVARLDPLPFSAAKARPKGPAVRHGGGQ
ncbi:MAG: insulinase family protein [Zoogloeaceae bacterium]|nr:insulinase family protein [Zoogloeaceae bacterium]